MRRAGHTRPEGTVTAPQRFSWGGEDPPQLGDIGIEITHEQGDPEELQRAFLVVGVEETSSRNYPYRITYERVPWGTEPEPGCCVWHWYRIPRGQR